MRGLSRVSTAGSQPETQGHKTCTADLMSGSLLPFLLVFKP